MNVKNLLLHIEYLLRHHECVIVPRIGAFIAHQREARIHLSDGRVTPPGRVISFNSSVCNNDPLLAHSISRREGIPFHEAEEMMEEAVERMIQTLEDTGRLDMLRLGTLELGSEDNIIYTPARSAEAAAAAMGLYPVTLPVCRDEQAENPTCADSKPKADKYYHFKVRKSVVKAAVIINLMLVGLGAAWLGLDAYQGEAKAEYASVVPIQVVAKAKSTLQTEEAVKKAETPQEAVKGSQGRYCLIVGTFNTNEEKERFLAANADSEYRLQEVPGRKVVRVAAMRSDNREELVALLNDENFSRQYPQSWIWEEKGGK